jgi:hypothetical protein
VLKANISDHSTGRVPSRQGERVPFAAMVRRSFRIGLRLGLLFGVAFALVKTVQSRRTASQVPPPAPWEPIVDTPRPAPRPEPVVEEPVVDEVGEPILEPAPPEEELLHTEVSPVDAPDPALDVIPEPPHEVTAPVKKVAAKKLPAAKKAATPRKAVAKKAAKKAAALPGFVEPEGGVCPPTHPVKAKLASRLFHLPGMFAYDRTRPDRCYLDADTAVADGFTSAKR